MVNYVYSLSVILMEMQWTYNMILVSCVQHHDSMLAWALTLDFFTLVPFQSPFFSIGVFILVVSYSSQVIVLSVPTSTSKCLPV